MKKIQAKQNLCIPNQVSVVFSVPPAFKKQNASCSADLRQALKARSRYNQLEASGSQYQLTATKNRSPSRDDRCTPTFSAFQAPSHGLSGLKMKGYYISDHAKSSRRIRNPFASHS